LNGVNPWLITSYAGAGVAMAAISGFCFIVTISDDL
jgi:hypothetical protein